MNTIFNELPPCVIISKDVIRLSMISSRYCILQTWCSKVSQDFIHKYSLFVQCLVSKFPQAKDQKTSVYLIS